MKVPRIQFSDITDENRSTSMFILEGINRVEKNHKELLRLFKGLNTRKNYTLEETELYRKYRKVIIKIYKDLKLGYK